jgi:hypothetical protein
MGSIGNAISSLFSLHEPNTQMYSGALSGTEKMPATDELDQPY